MMNEENTNDVSGYTVKSGDYTNVEDSFAMLESLMAKSKIVKDAKNSKHFNDITRSSCYINPYYMFVKTYDDPCESLKFTIGSETKCICCGDKVIDGWSTMMCPDCAIKVEKGE